MHGVDKKYTLNFNQETARKATNQVCYGIQRGQY
jgi:hypothetical protein